MENQSEIVSAESNPAHINGADNAAILSLLQSMKEEQLTKSDLNTINQMVDKKLESVQEKLESQNERMIQLETRLSQMENAGSNGYDNELMKQKILRNNIAIMGIPPTPNEDLTSIVSSVLKLLAANAMEKVESVYRTTPNAKRTLIIVKFSDYDTKIEVLNARAKKSIKLDQTVFKGASKSSAIVFINNHVTPYFGVLLYHGRQAIKQKKIHSCWIASNGCLLKMVEGGEPMGFKTVDELHGIIGTITSHVPNKRNLPDDSSPVDKDQNPKRRAT